MTYSELLTFAKNVKWSDSLYGPNHEIGPVNVYGVLTGHWQAGSICQQHATVRHSPYTL